MVKRLLIACFFLLASCGSEAPEICATGPTTYGIDVSKWQGTIDWPTVAKSIRFAMIRTSDGGTYTDERFRDNWNGAQQAGILRGAYQYFRPREDAIAQAEQHLQIMGSAGELPSVVDVEVTGDQSSAIIATKLHQWIDHVKSAAGVAPIIYTSPHFWSRTMTSEDAASFADTRLWIAHYGVACPEVPSPWTNWAFHQYSNTGRIDGIAGDVDLDVFNGSDVN